jgi:hypothetical protein
MSTVAAAPGLVMVLSVMTVILFSDVRANIPRPDDILSRGRRFSVAQSAAN